MNDTTLEPEKLDLRSHDIVADKRAELLRLFPEVRTEGDKIDFDKLRLALGEAVDVGRERFGLTWPGKAACFKAIQTLSLGTLRPAPEESVNFDTTENLIIEGDNLEVLKLLQKSYLGKVKMIYIDPPYNTGNDFIYPDDYSESLRTYLEYTGQVDAEGKRFSTNTDTDGRFHSKWLNMMYPRLYLARNLLREDGVIFISCDDNEVHHLRLLMNEVFGEENFIAVFPVQVNPRGRHLDQFVARTHDYVIVFAKDAANEQTMHGLEKQGHMVEEYDKQDERGRYRELGLRNRNQAFNPQTRPNLFFPLYVDPNDGTVSAIKTTSHHIEVWPVTSDGVKTCWTWSKDRVQRDRALLVARAVEDGSWRIFRKDYLESPDGGKATTLPKSLWTEKEFNNDYGRRALKELFGEAVIEFPKPPELIQKTLSLGTGPNDLILDFFAGSGTTAQAVLELNKQDGGNRKFILVQLPEPVDPESPAGKAGFRTIADICKERVRRVIRELDEQEAGQLDLEGGRKQDRGFRVFKLAESNFKVWDADAAKDAESLARQLELHVDHIREGRSEQDILFELLLKSGFPLTTPVETRTLAGKTVYRVADGAMLICLERELTLEAIRAMAAEKPARVVCLDAGFAGNDQLKANAVQTFKTAGVAKFQTV